MLPEGRGGIAPHYLVAGEIGLAVWFPFQSCAVGKSLGFDFDIRWRCRCEGEGAERRRVDSRDLRDVFEIAKLRQIPKLHPVFLPQVLVLMPEILVWLRHSYRRKTGVEKRAVIATPQVAVAPINNIEGHPVDLLFCYWFYEPRQLARGAVIFAAGADEGS